MRATLGRIRQKLRKIRLKSGNRLMIFNYHQVTETFDPKFHSVGTWTSKQTFEQEILFAKKNYNIISLRDLSPDKWQGTCVAITFDDGDISIKENVVPFLEKNQIPAIFFINSSCLENQSASWAHIYRYLKNYSFY